MLKKVSPLCGPQTRVLAMKGKWPREEVAAIPQGWRVEHSHDLVVPGLGEARCVIVLARVINGRMRKGQRIGERPFADHAEFQQIGGQIAPLQHLASERFLDLPQGRNLTLDEERAQSSHAPTRSAAEKDER
jgi:hypothetical protein